MDISKKLAACNSDKLSSKALDLDELGASLLEYALLAALIVVVAAVAIGTVGVETSKLFTDPKVVDAFDN
jgi:Flp pilus assembly pilin Flp